MQIADTNSPKFVAAPMVSEVDTLRFGSEKLKWYSIGRLAPLVLVLWVIVDVGLRFLPPQTFGIYPWQHARIGAGRFSPFAPNVQLRASVPVAAAAVSGNLPFAEPPVDMQFTTNKLGFRSTPGREREVPRLVTMAGSSFGYGYGLSDEHTLAAVLQRELQVSVFNSGRFFTDADGLVEFDHLLRQLPGKPQAVVFVYLEQQDLAVRGEDNPWPETEQPSLQSIRQLGHRTIGPTAYRNIEEQLLTFKRSFGTWLRLSPLEITTTRWQKALANDGILPNTHRNNVAVLQLTTGKRILFEHHEWRRATTERASEKLARTAAYLKWMQDELKERGLDMYLVMVPDKASVYRDWFQGPPEMMERLKQGSGATYMTSLYEAVSYDIKALDGTAILRRTAVEDVAAGRLAFYLDDAHWNALGADRIGRALAKMIASDPALSLNRTDTTLAREELVSGSGR